MPGVGAGRNGAPFTTGSWGGQSRPPERSVGQAKCSLRKGELPREGLPNRRIAQGNDGESGHGTHPLEVCAQVSVGQAM